ncbi:MAG TPA: winged helix DNA-binding domain-containing protein [Candidatus Dormibacteraeota bacterium]|nr:winged helix DNA-binding domain-containing protein [Candidatus Dormibacteraeota bacterium]
MPVPNASRILAERFTAQLLAGKPEHDPLTVAERLLAIQGQDPRGARLAIRARTTGLTSDDVDRALTEDRSLVITWLNRGTLHLVRSEDYGWLHAVTAPPTVSVNARRLREEGVTPAMAERGVALIRRSLAADGPQTRQELGQSLAAGRVRVEGQALVHLLLLASLRGLIVGGPMVSGRQAFALTSDWLGQPKPVVRERALAELARRYLAGHGPATDRDLAYWSGLALRDARAGLKAIGSETVERGDGLVNLKRARASRSLPPPRLLGSFDPVLFGWTSRDAILGADGPAVVSGGTFRPFAMVRGHAAATWSMRAGKVDLKPFRPVSRSDATALRADERDVRRFFNLT